MVAVGGPVLAVGALTEAGGEAEAPQAFDRHHSRWNLGSSFLRRSFVSGVWCVCVCFERVALLYACLLPPFMCWYVGLTFVSFCRVSSRGHPRTAQSLLRRHHTRAVAGLAFSAGPMRGPRVNLTHPSMTRSSEQHDTPHCEAAQSMNRCFSEFRKHSVAICSWWQGQHALARE